MPERTFVMVKPDAVKRGLVGEIIATFERTGLKLVAMKMLKPNEKLAVKHYPDTPEWYGILGGKTLEGYKLINKDVKAEMGTDDPVEIGKQVKLWLVDFLVNGTVVAMVWEGNAAVRNVRRLCGHTVPIMAEPSSIRGRFSLDSADAANGEGRPIHNLVHASGEKAEADFEIGLWFPELKV